jgi:integrase
MKPHAARNHLRALRSFLKHAKHDVTGGIKAPKAKSNKHKSWPVEVMAQYEAKHPVGTKARLAFALARYTGAGRAEIATMGPTHVVNGEISIARQKTNVTATITVHPELAAIIAATPTIGLATFLIAKGGRKFSAKGLGNQFRQWCDDAGIPSHYTMHGLRHTMGDTLAEKGSNPNEIASVLGHASVRTALHYTQGADRKVMSRKAMARLITGPNQARSGNEGVSEDNPPQPHRSKKI